jgi:hypothetical protein
MKASERVTAFKLLTWRANYIVFVDELQSKFVLSIDLEQLILTVASAAYKRSIS